MGRSPAARCLSWREEYVSKATDVKPMKALGKKTVYFYLKFKAVVESREKIDCSLCCTDMISFSSSFLSYYHFPFLNFDHY